MTTISGRDAISIQLERMGYERNTHYLSVGRYPLSIDASWELIDTYYLSSQATFEGSTCLSIGPGGNLGLEVLLYCYGADVVFLIDKYRFGINYPDITN